jgi:uncharacterized membrane protein YfcA
VPDLDVVALMALAGFGAGWVDAVVGGGGLVQQPALLLGFPGASHARILATNKIAGIAGTPASSVTYWRRATGPAHRRADGSRGLRRCVRPLVLGGSPCRAAAHGAGWVT